MPRGIVEFDRAPSLASHEILPFEPSRMSLTFFAPLAGQVTVYHEAITTDGNGIVLPAGAPPFHLTYHQHGEIVRRAWFVKGVQATAVVAWLSTLH